MAFSKNLRETENPAALQSTRLAASGAEDPQTQRAAGLSLHWKLKESGPASAE